MDTESSSEGRPFIDPSNVVTTGPYAGLPVLPEGMIWTEVPMNSSYLEDPEWYDPLGIDMLDQREVFDITETSKLHEVLQELLDEFPEKGTEMMFRAAVEGKPEMIRWLSSKGVKAHPEEGVENDDMTCVPIHAAAFQGKLDCVKVLVEEAGVSVDARDEAKGTPLMRAAKGKWPDIVEWLIEKGASLTATQETNGQGNFTAFDFAALAGDMACITKVFQAMADKFEADGKDQREIVTSLALQAAAASNSVEVLNFMLEKGGFPLVKDKGPEASTTVQLNESQRDAIEMALRRAQAANADLLRVLMSYLTTTNVDGQLLYFQTPPKMKGILLSIADNAASRGDSEAFELMWHTALNDPAQNEEKLTILSNGKPLELLKQDVLNEVVCSAVEGGHLDMVKLLVGYGANIHVAHGQSFTPPLYTAAAKNHIDIVRYLLEDLGADIDRAGGRYANGPTPLAIAVMEGLPDIVKLLLMHGGPVESIEDQAQPGKATRLVISSAKVYPQQVKVVFVNDSYNEEAQPGTSTLTIKLDDGDLERLQHTRRRKSDEKLAKTDPFGRECRRADEAS